MLNQGVAQIPLRLKICCRETCWFESDLGHQGGWQSMTPPALDLSSLRAAVASFEDSLDIVGDAAWFDAQSPRVRNTLTAGVI